MSNNAKDHLHKPMSKEQSALIKEYFDLLTNEQSQSVHPQFFDMTAEEHAEILDSKKNKLQELGVAKFDDNGEINFFLDEFPFFFDDYRREDCSANSIVLAPIGKVAPNTVFIEPTDTPAHLKWANESETIEPISRSSVDLPEKSFGIAGDTIRELMLERLRVHLSEKPATLSYRFHQGGRDYISYLKQQLMEAVMSHLEEPPTKSKHKKADYKNKVYKNTAKKAKVSPIMMALINKSK